MIIPNGYLVAKHAGQSGLAPDTGYPLPGQAERGIPVRCQYIPVRHNAQGLVQGEHVTLASYTILIESSQRGAIDSERVELRGDSGGAIGEFSILNMEELRAVQQVKYTV